ncbi:hypothetical protein FB451DRAFT_1520099 [Mycena latifolia]|nr:hypothetical protein FB451DRAFT_1520099 [Mycena latifolia]
MPITELATLELIAPCTLQSTSLLKLLKILAQRQSAHSAFPLAFFSDTRSPTRIYILSGWHSLQASHTWLNSTEWLEMAIVLENLRELTSRLYLDISFDNIPKGGTLCIRQQCADRGTRSSRNRIGTRASAFWEADVKELEGEPEGNETYRIEVYMNESSLEVIGSPREGSAERATQVS